MVGCALVCIDVAALEEEGADATTGEDEGIIRMLDDPGIIGSLVDLDTGDVG